MRKLIVKMSFSIDGFVGSPNGENNWIFKSSDASSRAWAIEKMRQCDLIIMGRKSFEEMAPYWPQATGPFAGPMNEIPKGVFTKKGFQGADLSELPPSPAVETWKAARIFCGDLKTQVKELKSEPGKSIYAIGGAGFVHDLAATGLVDEYHLVTHPVILGQGLAVFNGVQSPLDLKLIEAQSFPGGIVAHVYQQL